VDGEEWIFGAGSYNMKAAHGAYMAAVNAIIKSGVKLKGDIMLSATVGEIEAAQIDDFQGPLYRGGGAGAAHAASHGIVPDFAVLGEPTELNLMIGHFGSFWTKVTIGGGTVIHTGHSRDVDNVIEKMPVVIEHFTKFKEEFANKTSYKGYKGLVNIAAVTGGRPWKTSRTPDSASIYLDIRFPPGFSPLQIKAEVDRVIHELSQQFPELDLYQQPFASNPATELKDDDYVVKSIQSAHKDIFGEAPKTIYELWYSNAPPLNSMGAQAINYGSAGSRRIEGLTLSDKDREYVHVGDLYEISKVYTKVALDICSKDRAEVRPDLAM
jgi:acetylornithine deacetylase/succinyl-diaminopimelate desuccinylase-like protein